MIRPSRLTYLVEKYNIAERNRTFPVQKNCSSRGNVSTQSYRANAGYQGVRRSLYNGTLSTGA